jgi:hypothetical protein
LCRQIADFSKKSVQQGVFGLKMMDDHDSFFALKIGFWQQTGTATL